MNRLPRVETLLVLACAAGAALLAGSQFTSLFELTPQGGEALQTVEPSDQHGYATFVLAVFALVMLVVGIAARTESMTQIAAFAVAASGAVALLIFLVVDLPDANSVGTVDDARESFIDAEAHPVAGFWFELVGSLVLAVCGACLATLGPDSFSIRLRGGEAAAAETGNGTSPDAPAPKREAVGAGARRRRPRAGREAGGAIGAEDETEDAAGDEPKTGREDGGGGISLPSLPKPKLPKNPFSRRKRIGQRNPQPETPADEDEEPGGFNWPSRPGRGD